MNPIQNSKPQETKIVISTEAKRRIDQNEQQTVFKTEAESPVAQPNSGRLDAMMKAMYYWVLYRSG